MMHQYLISDLAKRTQLPTDTIRFYEKKKLIKSSFRADNNYKYYDDEKEDLLKDRFGFFQKYLEF